MPERLKVLLVTTGGTITMLRNGGGALSPCRDAGMLTERVPELAELADVDLLPVSNTDSSNIQPGLWVDTRHLRADG